MEVKNRYVTLVHAIDGSPSETDFVLKDTLLTLTVKERSNEVIVRNLYLSIDPSQLNRMKSYSSSQTVAKFASRIVPGQVINANGVGRVVASANPQFEKGDLVAGLLGWEEYSVIQGANIIRKLDPSEFPLSHHVSVLGTSGHTAYSGFYHICKPQKGEKVFVSAASGSVGNIVGQLAKMFGCYVVGCAGSKQKVDVLKEKLGFDDAFNYKEETDLKSALKRYFPDGIDIYFDNVGGEMLDAAVANMNAFGRVALCGVISEYTNTGRRAAPNMLDVVYKRITIQGFLLIDQMEAYPDFISKMSDHLRRGQIHVLEDISKGIESTPSALIGLFRGDNIGKTIIKLEEEQS